MGGTWRRQSRCLRAGGRVLAMPRLHTHTRTTHQAGVLGDGCVAGQAVGAVAHGDAGGARGDGHNGAPPGRGREEEERRAGEETSGWMGWMERCMGGPGWASGLGTKCMPQASVPETYREASASPLNTPMCLQTPLCRPLYRPLYRHHALTWRSGRPACSSRRSAGLGRPGQRTRTRRWSWPGGAGPCQP